MSGTNQDNLLLEKHGCENGDNVLRRDVREQCFEVRKIYVWKFKDRGLWHFQPIFVTKLVADNIPISHGHWDSKYNIKDVWLQVCLHGFANESLQ